MAMLHCACSSDEAPDDLWSRDWPPGSTPAKHIFHRSELVTFCRALGTASLAAVAVRIFWNSSIISSNSSSHAMAALAVDDRSASQSDLRHRRRWLQAIVCDALEEN